jgi:hypothetical protein
LEIVFRNKENLLSFCGIQAISGIPFLPGAFHQWNCPVNRTTALHTGGIAEAHFRSHSTTNHNKKQKNQQCFIWGNKL